MKKLILTPPPEQSVIYRDELFQQREFPIVGCVFGDNKDKVFFIPDGYRSKKYFARTNTRFGTGNQYGNNSATLVTWFCYFPVDKTEWFVFDDSQELFKWLSE